MTTVVVAFGCLLSSFVVRSVGTPSGWALARAVARADPSGPHTVRAPCVTRGRAQYCFGQAELAGGPTEVYRVTVRGHCFRAYQVMVEDHGAHGEPFYGCARLADQVPRPWHEFLPASHADQVRRLVDDATQPDPAAAG